MGKIIIGEISEDVKKKDLKNCLQLLYQIHKTKSLHRGSLGITKTQKLSFLIEFHQRFKGFNGFDFDFFRWNYGPMTADIYRLIEMLKDAEAIEKSENFTVTEGGFKILEVFNPVFEENADIVRETEENIETYGKMSAGYLKDYIYDNFWLGKTPLRDVGLGTDLIIPIRGRKRDFIISEDWLETLEIYFDRDLYDGLKQALKNAQTEKTKRW